MSKYILLISLLWLALIVQYFVKGESTCSLENNIVKPGSYCLDTFQCRYDYKCINNSCVQSKENMVVGKKACLSGIECGSPYLCVNGICSFPKFEGDECQSNDICRFGTCKDNKCTFLEEGDKCDESKSCGTKQFCDKGVCKTRKNIGDDCDLTLEPHTGTCHLNLFCSGAKCQYYATVEQESCYKCDPLEGLTCSSTGDGSKRCVSDPNSKQLPKLCTGIINNDGDCVEGARCNNQNATACIEVCECDNINIGTCTKSQRTADIDSCSSNMASIRLTTRQCASRNCFGGDKYLGQAVSVTDDGIDHMMMDINSCPYKYCKHEFWTSNNMYCCMQKKYYDKHSSVIPVPMLVQDGVLLPDNICSPLHSYTNIIIAVAVCLFFGFLIICFLIGIIACIVRRNQKLEYSRMHSETGDFSSNNFLSASPSHQDPVDRLRTPSPRPRDSYTSSPVMSMTSEKDNAEQMEQEDDENEKNVGPTFESQLEMLKEIQKEKKIYTINDNPNDVELETHIDEHEIQ